MTRTLRRTLLSFAWLVIIFGLSACDKKPVPYARGAAMNAPAFWVWHRSSPLTKKETNALSGAGAESLYWQAAEFSWKERQWTMNRVASPRVPVPGLQITPVFRITPNPEFLGHPKAASQLAAALKPWRENQASEIQLDFDCPDRVIVKYARFLQEFGKAVSPTKVSITALADWPKHPDFGLLAESVSSFSPMFYDIAADQPELVIKSKFQPMADPAAAERIARWANCPKPWLAGLPNFERLSIFLHDGKLSGHVRGWTHDSVIFNPALRPTVLDHGTTLYEVTAPLDLSGTQVIPGQKIVHRMPDRKILAELVSAADRAGAKGIIYFTLPGPGLLATYSPGDLARVAEAGDAVLEVLIGKNGAVTLTNTGHIDLPCQPGTQEARGWALEIQSEHAGAFRSASPGAFVEIQTPDGTPPEFSRTILLRFSKLSSGSAVFSGPIVQEKRGLKWRVRGLGGVCGNFQEFR